MHRRQSPPKPIDRAVPSYEVFLRDATPSGGPLVGVTKIACDADDESGASEQARHWLERVSERSLAPDDVLFVVELRKKRTAPARPTAVVNVRMF
jgi:hypothetical protein